jgi:ATP-dependent Clp protease ATP-binding subunit ClpB
VDFSRAMIFLTSNLGSKEIEDLVRPKLGFAAGERGSEDADAGKISRTGMEAARRRFSPEFMNRLDKVVVFKSLGPSDLREILQLELQLVRDRVHRSTGTTSIDFQISETAQAFLLEQGTDARYGARHLKRAIERLLVQPLANLIATRQMQAGDLVLVELDRGRFLFFKQTGAPAASRQMTAPQSLAA